MGMYTRLDLNVAIRPDNTELIHTLQRMVAGNAPELEGRSRWMFWSSSYYHDNIQHASLIYDDISNMYKLSVVCDLKNYEGEIEKLLEMIAPYTNSRFAGYVRYEENSVPDLVWFVEGKMIRCSPEVPLSVLSTIEGV